MLNCRNQTRAVFFMIELNIIKYLQLPVPAAFAIAGVVLIRDAATNSALLWLYVPFALISFGIGIYLYRWAVDNTNRTVIAVQRARARSKIKKESELTKRAEIRNRTKIIEGQNIQTRRQAESEKTIHKGIRKAFEKLD